MFLLITNPRMNLTISKVGVDVVIICFQCKGVFFSCLFLLYSVTILQYICICVRYEIPECRFMFYFLCFFVTTSATLTIYFYLC